MTNSKYHLGYDWFLLMHSHDTISSMKKRWNRANGLSLINKLHAVDKAQHAVQAELTETSWKCAFGLCFLNEYRWFKWRKFVVYREAIDVLSLDREMGDSEQESINEEFIDFAIRESIQDVSKEPQTNRYDWVQMSKILQETWVGAPINGTSLLIYWHIFIKGNPELHHLRVIQHC